jgi:stringent starvation protein B
MEASEMESSKPYLLRALHEWILDNGLTPHIIVDIHARDVEVPAGAEQDGKLVLNIAPRAVRHLEMGNELFSFEARFAGTPQRVRVPVAAIVAIYARENGQGMVFASDGASGDDTPDSDSQSGSGDDKRGGPHLRVIK